MRVLLSARMKEAARWRRWRLLITAIAACWRLLTRCAARARERDDAMRDVAPDFIARRYAIHFAIIISTLPLLMLISISMIAE
jgi:hypothetical protein